VLTPAERDAMTNGTNGNNGTYNRNGYGQNGSHGRNGSNGSNGHTPQDASGDEEMEHKIDQAAEAGAHPLADDEPRTQVIEVPDGGRVDPSEDY
jgi:cell division protease FtsH